MEGPFPMAPLPSGIVARHRMLDIPYMSCESGGAMPFRCNAEYHILDVKMPGDDCRNVWNRMAGIENWKKVVYNPSFSTMILSCFVHVSPLSSLRSSRFS